MKETELITQMTTEIRNSQELSAAIQLLGLEDYLNDLEQKNQAFAQLVKGRTASTEGYQKGAVAEARVVLEQKYQLLRQMLNVASIYEGDTAYRAFILAVNAIIEHYRQILARKGISTGTTSTNTGGSTGTGTDTGTTTPATDDEGGTGTTTPENPSTGGGSGTTTPTDPNPGTGGTGGTGDEG